MIDDSWKSVYISIALVSIALGVSIMGWEVFVKAVEAVIRSHVSPECLRFPMGDL